MKSHDLAELRRLLTTALERLDALEKSDGDVTNDAAPVDASKPIVSRLIITDRFAHHCAVCGARVCEECHSTPEAHAAGICCRPQYCDHRGWICFKCVVVP